MLIAIRDAEPAFIRVSAHRKYEWSVLRAEHRKQFLLVVSRVRDGKRLALNFANRISKSFAEKNEIVSLLGHILGQTLKFRS